MHRPDAEIPRNRPRFRLASNGATPEDVAMA